MCLFRCYQAGVAIGGSQQGTASPSKADGAAIDQDTAWNVDDEYDPAKPNDYDEICIHFDSMILEIVHRSSYISSNCCD